MSKPAAGQMLFKNEALHLSFCIVGVVGSLLLYGVLQVRGGGGYSHAYCCSSALVKAKAYAGINPSTILLCLAGTHHDHTIRYRPGCRGLQV
jgi:hypothetical protein